MGIVGREPIQTGPDSQVFAGQCRDVDGQLFEEPQKSAQTASAVGFLAACLTTEHTNCYETPKIDHQVRNVVLKVLRQAPPNVISRVTSTDEVSMFEGKSFLCIEKAM